MSSEAALVGLATSTEALPRWTSPRGFDSTRSDFEDLTGLSSSLDELELELEPEPELEPELELEDPDRLDFFLGATAFGSLLDCSDLTSVAFSTAFSTGVGN